MIKKIRIELTIFTLLLISIFISYSIDFGLYNYFSKVNYGIGGTNLKEFFTSITELGDALWYFLIFLLIFLFSFLANKINLVSLNNYTYLKNFSLYGFVYLLLTGLLTQILKLIVGRPRPNHTNLDDGFLFNFFTTDSAFHSFPSGHSSTIIAVVIILSLALPSLKVFFYICGLLIGLSRVVVGAHFVTDVIAGALVAIISYKILDLFFKIKYPELCSNNFKIKNISFFVKGVIVFFVFGVFLTIGPKFDVFLSSLFYYGNNEFLLQSYYAVSIIFRKILLPFLLIYIFIFPLLSKFFPMKKIFFDYKFSMKEIVFIWLSGAVTLILVVNVLLKNMWGRTRPNDILQFNGSDYFTPWYKFGESCLSNCSFVSGDASVGFMMFVFYFIMKKNIYCYLAMFSGIVLGFVRVIAGGHFLSDIVFSHIVVVISLSISFNLYKRLNDK